MQTGAGHFTNGVKARQAGSRFQVGGNTSHPIVGCWSHWNWLLFWVNPKVVAPFQDGGKAPQQRLSVDGGEVQPHMRDPLGLHATNQSATDLISWG